MTLLTIGMMGPSMASPDPSPTQGVSLRVTRVDVDSLTAGEVAEWSTLFAAQPSPSNPFLAMPWVRAWYHAYVPEEERRHLLWVRDERTGELLGIAPMHLQTTALGPVVLASRLMPVGAGLTSTPLELPGVLAATTHIRDVSRALTSQQTVGHWRELPLADSQGWFDPDWAGFGTGRKVAFVEQQRAYACVVLPLSSTWDATRSGLKRNVKESIRRSTNRLKKSGRPFRVDRLGEGIDAVAINRLLDLHRARSATDRSSQRHHDAFADESSRQLLHAVLPELGALGLASIFELSLDSEVIASQLVLHSPGTSYVHSSGFDAAHWSLGPITFLHSQLIQHAIDRGDTWVNFSPGPSVSKLRWSHALHVVNSFAYGSGPRSLSLRFALYQAARAFRNRPIVSTATPAGDKTPGG